MGRTVTSSRRAGIALLLPAALLAACGGSSRAWCASRAASGPATKASFAAEVPAAV